ncbi:hypothetical protein [Helicobacter fennelliae]|uniref:Periplasmic protein n=2 Tax=Helicobacter fennelliae TaxID=215 RepID=T1D3I1_9HELI|nr:hypothetical protein [Helicobacter fennelliae]GAD19776.1 hypothetical protein HFN_1016 [Helicobacter fennelliae MRY12-0050]STP08030.1 Uncharacterised protein [Helicobacter fennelliae]STQ84061.1 Uncharacterised protein [Helicobacter fennelliae]
MSMGRFFICICIICSFLSAAKPTWDFTQSLTLKKDEVYTTTFSIAGMPKELRFYWTLYKNYGLVINLNYDKFPYQFILYTDYKRKSFKIPLSQGNDRDKDAYLLISFEHYDEKAKTATLWLGMMMPKQLSS